MATSTVLVKKSNATIANENVKTAPKKATKKTDAIKTGKAMQSKEKELTQLDKELAMAREKLSVALAWNTKLSTHMVTLANGKTRQYISVDKGMPRDISVILIEGKDHNVSVKYLSRDKKHEGTEEKPISADEQAYNDNAEKWAKVCGREATKRITTILESVKGYDELWAMVKILERNEEIKKSDRFAQFFA